jgi:hypothetical protein
VTFVAVTNKTAAITKRHRTEPHSHEDRQAETCSRAKRQTTNTASKIERIPDNMSAGLTAIFNLLALCPKVRRAIRIDSSPTFRPEI